MDLRTLLYARQWSTSVVVITSEVVASRDCNFGSQEKNKRDINECQDQFQSEFF
jgi:hypothetical protein